MRTLRTATDLIWALREAGVPPRPAPCSAPAPVRAGRRGDAGRRHLLDRLLLLPRLAEGVVHVGVVVHEAVRVAAARAAAVALRPL